MKFQTITFLLTSFLSFNAYSFHMVTEILPSGKMLVCQDYNQIKKGGIAEVYEKFRADTDRNVKMVKMRELTLPKVGDKVKLTHSDYHQVGTTSVTEYHTEESGVATVVEAKSLLGEKRYVRKAPNEYKVYDFNETSTINESDVEAIDKKCLVLVSDEKITELKKVSW